MASSLGTFAPFTLEHEPSGENGHAVGTEKPVVKGVLDVEIHQARNLHNICIYAKQDVYAKLTLTRPGAPEVSFLTEVVDKGGKDPVFNQKLSTSVVPSDHLLRCEVWMASKMRDYLQDQLLGVVSIPLAGLVGAGRQFNDYGLSSTELFHSPSGSLEMTLEFVEEDRKQQQQPASGPLARSQSGQSSQSNTSYDFPACNSATSNVSASSESEHVCGIDSKVEFTNLADAREDEELVSDFMRRAKRPSLAGGGKDEGIFTGPPFLELNAEVVEKAGEQEQVVEGAKEEQPEVVKADPEEGKVEADEQVLQAGKETSKFGLKQLEVAVSTSSSQLESSITNGLATPTPTPSSKLKGGVVEESEKSKVSGEEEAGEYGKVKKVEVVAEARIMQEEIMDMYTKSMQQFSEALAKMQLPVDENGVIKLDESDTNSEKKKNKESSSESGGERSSETGNGTGTGGKRVFYGSRAFF